MADPRKKNLFYVARWMVAGSLLGLVVVAVAWRMAVAELGVVTFVELHDAMPVMWVVDLAPTLLGAVGAVIGVLHLRSRNAFDHARDLAQDIAAAWTSDLQLANVALAASLDDREKFYAALTHELRTPLSSILGYSELAEEMAPEASEVSEYIGEIYRSAALLLEMVNDLLDAAKLSQQGMKLNVEDVDGDAIANEVATLLRPLADSKALRIDKQLTADTLCRADPARLRQVVTNLVANAIKYSDQGKIVIRTLTDGGRYVIEIEDQGPGLTEEDIERIFLPFEQASGSTRRDSTGLGLAVSRSFADAMDGTLSVLSDGPDTGSTFRLELPPASGLAPQTREARLAGTAV